MGKNKKNKKQKFEYSPSASQPVASSQPLASNLSHSLQSQHRIVVLLLIILGFSFTLSMSLTPLTTNDFWMQLKIGDMIKESGTIPRTILFTHNESKDFPFFAHEWLSSYAYSLWNDWFGYTGLIILKGITYLFIILLTVTLGIQISKNIPLAFLYGLICVYGTNYRTLLRPELFSQILLLGSLNLLMAYCLHKNSKWLWPLPLISLLWANSHGSFILGIGLPALFGAALVADHLWSHYILKKRLDLNLIKKDLLPLIYVFISLVSISLINPYGFGLFAHSLDLSRSAFIRETIYEWYPPFKKTARGTYAMGDPGFSIYVSYLIFFAASCIYGLITRKVRPFHLIVGGFFLYMSFDAQRHIGLFVIAGTIPIIKIYSDLFSHKKRQVILGMTTIALFFSGLYYSLEHGNSLRIRPSFEYRTPIHQKTIEFIKNANIEGDVFNSYAYGAQLAYHFYPKIKIVMDSRVDAYGKEYHTKFLSAASGRTALNFLEYSNISYIIIKSRDARFMLRDFNQFKNRGWTIFYNKLGTTILKKT